MQLDPCVPSWNCCIPPHRVESSRPVYRTCVQSRCRCICPSRVDLLQVFPVDLTCCCVCALSSCYHIYAQLGSFIFAPTPVKPLFLTCHPTSTAPIHHQRTRPAPVRPLHPPVLPAEHPVAGVPRGQVPGLFLHVNRRQRQRKRQWWW